MIKLSAVIGEVIDVIHEALAGLVHGDRYSGDDDALADILESEGEEDDRLEKLVMFLESKFNVTLTDDEVKRTFRHGTVSDLARDISSHLMVKSADYKAFKTHQRYYRHRHQAAIKRKQYRMTHLHQERRRSKIYRRKVKRGQIRPAKRYGNPQTGYKFRGGYGQKRKRR
jgi:hypothetical protein